MENSQGMLAYCGLNCQTCPIYLATRQEDLVEQSRMRAEIARLCKEHYGLDYAMKDITDCDGCHTEGMPLFSACQNCPIRNCAREKQLENCAVCPDYACEKLERFFVSEPSVRKRLEAIRRDAF